MVVRTLTVFTVWWISCSKAALQNTEGNPWIRASIGGIFALKLFSCWTRRIRKIFPFSTYCKQVSTRQKAAVNLWVFSNFQGHSTWLKVLAWVVTVLGWTVTGPRFKARSGHVSSSSSVVVCCTSGFYIPFLCLHTLLPWTTTYIYCTHKISIHWLYDWNHSRYLNICNK